MIIHHDFFGSHYEDPDSGRLLSWEEYQRRYHAQIDATLQRYREKLEKEQENKPKED